MIIIECICGFCFPRTFAACDKDMCIVTIFVSSDLRKALPYQKILQNIFAGDADLLVEINESIKNFLSKEDLALNQYSDQPEEKRPRLAEHLTNQPQQSVDNNKIIDLTKQSALPTLLTATTTLITTQTFTTTTQSTVQFSTITPKTPTTQSLSTFSTPLNLSTQIASNPLVPSYNIKKEKDINFGIPSLASSELPISNNQNSANNRPLVEAGQSSSETISLPSTSGLNMHLLQSPFGTVSSSELKDLPAQILEKINFFSQDSQSISRNKNKSSDLLDDRGGNICNFLMSKETVPGTQVTYYLAI